MDDKTLDGHALNDVAEIILNRQTDIDDIWEFFESQLFIDSVTEVIDLMGSAEVLPVLWDELLDCRFNNKHINQKTSLLLDALIDLLKAKGLPNETHKYIDSGTTENRKDDICSVSSGHSTEDSGADSAP